VAIQVEPDRFFRREGLDVIGVCHFNLAQALARLEDQGADPILSFPPPFFAQC